MDEQQLDSQPEPALNPWIAIWTKPRETIQQIVDTDPNHLVLLLAALGGVSQTLDRASIRSAGDQIEIQWIFLIAAVGGPIFGIIGLYIGAALVRWTGQWLGGTGSSENIRAAIAWGNVPIVLALVLWIPELALFGEELFTAEMPRMEANPMLAVVFTGFMLVEMVIGIWTIVIVLQCLGQVQGYSAWRALANTLLAVMVIVVPLVLVAITIAAFGA